MKPTEVKQIQRQKRLARALRENLKKRKAGEKKVRPKEERPEEQVKN